MTWLDVRNSTYDVISTIKEMIGWIISFLTDSSIYDDLNATVSGNAIIGAINSTAITLCVLFFLIDFFQKSLHLQWITWENVIMFFMKLIMAKLIVNNAGYILKIIQNGFNSLLESVALGDVANKMFPHIAPPPGIEDATGNSFFVQYFFSSSIDGFEKIIQGSTSISTKAMIYNVEVFIIGLIMKIVFIMTAIIVIARVFELLVYTAIAPIPLATLSCEGLQEVGKGFLKSFAAVCIQAAIIVLMIIIYTAMFTNPSILNFDFFDPMWRAQVRLLLCTFIFGAGVMQSGNWSKKICGTM